MPILTLRAPAQVWMLALLAVTLGAWGVPARAEDAPRATLTVVGQGEASATPDQAVFSTGVVSTAKTADEALAANSKAVAGVIEAIKASGIEARDIATSGFSIQPQYAQPQQGSREPLKVSGYEVRNGVSVRVRDLAQLGTLLDKVVQAGANQAGGLRFDLSNPDELSAKAQIAALDNARAQAETLAKAAGMRLLRLRRISPGERASIGGAPMMMMKAEARAVPLEAGETTAHAQVTLMYEIEPL
ncbi:MAG: hypothetical protein B7Z15_05040 [Rhizobiales bacterium 32-66-8]|nr:MAG: hypothetical protein B7Z15_05040 [Rhizobiales bacterium 32-66-8]